ncbi:MAG TPA: type II secretion system minor pseudopilin GspK [Noviherbaspirillum sp.]|uniref:type II secretion system minor pseudopilin GspK n=1 Tax=Noviherbaspirillum sp. TaxID=1926288 RepID=UPI002D4A8DA7|nr:type II secretion system minor pseudopilin GspK [Noviherbaspirillum sp.]HYD96441.1 type II secretion system minor pseudopilin GspK [Noviherbaspirillum sp.]
MKRRTASRQRGVAVITALLLTTLAVTIVASLFWQQQVQVRSIENQRLQLQKQWILRGALDWTRLILREDFRTKKTVDHLGEPWAVPLAETRLDQYVDKDSASDAPDAALSGGIVDAQARFNLRNLIQNGNVNAGELAAFTTLLTLLQVNPQLAPATAALMQSAQPKPVSGSGTGTPPAPAAPAAPADNAAPLPMDIQHVDDLLAVPGFTPEILAKIRDYVIVLPKATKINVNTAPAEVIAAKIATLSLSDASALVAARRNRFFERNEDLRPFLPRAELNLDGIDYKTGYFLVNGNVRMNRAGMEMQALLSRADNGATSILWIHEY